MKINIKKLMAVILTAIFMIGAMGCGKTQSNVQSNEDSKAVSSQNDDENRTTEKVDLGKVLIVYYSYTGNTRKLTDKLQKMTNADVVEIEPVTPYSDDYDTVVSQAKKEETDNFMPEIKTKVDNIDSYDYILIGSPIWWYQVACPVKTFLSQTDLANKKVALFVTHGGWGLGQSEDNIHDLCPNSDILKSLAINGDDVSASDKEAAEWLNGLK